MTVSRALSAHPHVNAETREMVFRRAREVGYVKNRAANAMRGDSTGIVGLLLPNIINEFYARFANELGLLCSDSGLDLLVTLTNDEPAREQAGLDRLLALQASSVILVPAPGGEPRTQDGDTHFIELIRTRCDDHSSLLVEDETAMRAAVHHLAARGCTRIGYIGATASLSSGRRRQQAYQTAMSEAGLTIDSALVRTGDPGREFGMTSMLDLLDSTNPPQGVLCGGFETSNGALEGCLTRNVRFPDDMAFVGYGDPELYRWLAGGVTTIRVAPDKLARGALSMVIAGRDSAPESPPHAHAELILRQSA